MFCVKEVFCKNISACHDTRLISDSDDATFDIIDYDTKEELTINAHDFQNYNIIGVVKYMHYIVVCKISKIDWAFMDCIEDIRIDESTRNENAVYMVHKGCEDEPNAFAIAIDDKIISQDYMVMMSAKSFHSSLHSSSVHFLPKVVLYSVLKACMDNVEKMYIHHKIPLAGENLVDCTTIITFNDKLNRFLTKYKTLERKN